MSFFFTEKPIFRTFLSEKYKSDLGMCFAYHTWTNRRRYSSKLVISTDKRKKIYFSYNVHSNKRYKEILIVLDKIYSINDELLGYVKSENDFLCNESIKLGDDIGKIIIDYRPIGGYTKYLISLGDNYIEFTYLVLDMLSTMNDCILKFKNEIVKLQSKTEVKKIESK